MKKLLLSVLLSTSAFAGNEITLGCRIFSSQTSIPITVEIESGMNVHLKCDKLSCPKDYKYLDIRLGYNGNSYEDISLMVTDKRTNTTTYTNYENMKIGSSIQFKTSNIVKNTFLIITCDVDDMRQKIKKRMLTLQVSIRFDF